jgi:hypothetical protein
MIINTRKYFLTTLIIVLCHPLMQAQPYPCGTIVTQEQQDFEGTLTDSVTRIPELNRTFHLSVFIAKDNKGQSNLNPADLNAAIAQLNTAFEPINVTFSLYNLSYIDNYHFDEIRLATNENDLFAQNTIQNTINIYLVFKLYNETNLEIGGYTYYPSASKDVLIMEKSCLSGVFLTEQIGHFFNLYHAHETVFGNELTGRSNCSTAGDLCCDTPADPNLTARVSEDCQYTGTNKDAGGDFFVPSTANFMSFGPANCRCYFSDEQFIRMINCMLLVKKHLW